MKGGEGILNYHEGSHITALMKIYSEINLKKEKFLHHKEINWKDTAKQRTFFDNLAKSKQFNPLDAQKWYTITHRDVISAGGSGVLNYHKSSHISALVELYPELKLQKEKFPNYKQREKS